MSATASSTVVSAVFLLGAITSSGTRGHGMDDQEVVGEADPLQTFIAASTCAVPIRCLQADRANLTRRTLVLLQGMILAATRLSLAQPHLLSP